MGKPTGFMEYAREDAPASSPKARIQNYNEFHEELSETERKQQAARWTAVCRFASMEK